LLGGREKGAVRRREGEDRVGIGGWGKKKYGDMKKEQVGVVGREEIRGRELGEGSKLGKGGVCPHYPHIQSLPTL